MKRFDALVGPNDEVGLGKRHMTLLNRKQFTSSLTVFGKLCPA
jgi:hypothetical protein